MNSGNVIGAHSSIGLDNGAPIVALYNLETMNPDLGYLSVNKRVLLGSNPPTWHFVPEHTDGLFENSTGAWPSLVADGNGTIHVAYNSETQVRYSKRTNGVWSITPITTPSFEGCGGTFASLAVNAANHPFIAYYVVCLSEIFLAEWTGTAWTYDVVVNDTEFEKAQSFISLKLNGAGQPCIAYHAYDDGSLRFAARTASGWQIEEIPGTSGSFDVSLELDPSGAPGIAFTRIVNVNNQNLEVPSLAWKSSGNWYVEAAGPAGLYGGRTPRLQFNAQGEPHVVYGARVSSTLTSSTWDLMLATRAVPGPWSSNLIQRVTVPHSDDWPWFPAPSFLLNRANDELHVTFSPEIWPVPPDILDPENKVRYAHGIKVTEGGGGEEGGCPHCIDPALDRSAGLSAAPRILNARLLGGGGLVVRLSLPYAMGVEGALFDVAGRSIGRLGRQQLDRGIQEITVPTAELAPGLCLVRLQTSTGQNLVTKVFVQAP